MAPSTSLQFVSLISLLSLQSFAAVTLERIAQVPAGWSHTGTPSDSAQIVLQVALAHQNLDQLEPKLASVSTPGSSSYGQYLDLDDVKALFSPSAESSTAVESWLKSSGVTSYTTRGDSIWFQTNVSTANSMLGTTMKTYSDSAGVRKLRTTEYSIPEHLVNHVQLISPTTYFGKSKAQRAAKVKATKARRIIARADSPLSGDEPASCKATIVYQNRTFPVFTPDCLREQYNVNGYTPKVSSGSKIAFGSFLNESASFSDLTLYEEHFGFPIQNFSVVLINGGTDLPQPPPLEYDGEANLDVQDIVSIAHPLPIIEYITGGSPPYFPDPVEPVGTPNENEPYLEYYEYLLSQSNEDLPQVITNSYGDEEQTVPEAYAVRVCNLIGIMGLRGISVLESSGDEGVGASCLSTDGTAAQFNPIFPATCPYVTSVGGTVKFNPEVGWSGSSGGFSYYFKRPWYQNIAVQSYLDNYVSAETKEYYAPYVNFSGRAFPDVAAHSVSPDYPVYQGGELTPSGGTSAASPITASIIALLNDAQLRNGKPALGFLNPLIYLYAYQGFTDITTGSTDGCNGYDTQNGEQIVGAGIVPGAHWNATEGWDPVTGFGVPDFEKLLDLLSDD